MTILRETTCLGASLISIIMMFATGAQCLGQASEAPRTITVVPGTTSDITGTTVRLRVLLSNLVPAMESTRLLVYRWHSGAWHPAAWDIERTRQGLILSLDHGCIETDRYLIRSSSATTLPFSPAAGCAEPIPARLEPAARVYGRLSRPERSTLPEVGRLQIFPSSFSSSLFVSEGFPVRFLDDRNWEVLVPVPGISGRLTVSGFAPVSFEVLALKPSASTDLGEIKLTKGATVVVRIVSVSGIPVRGATVHVIKEESVARVAASVYRNEKFESQAIGQASESGWVNLADLSSGLAHLLVLAPASPPYFSAALDLRPQTEAFLGDVVLPEAGSIFVRLEGAPDSLGLIQSFTVYARPLGDEHWKEQVQSLAVAAEGESATFDSLLPGLWDLLVVAADSFGQRYPVGGLQVDLHPGAIENTTVPIEAALLQGEVVSLGRPVEALLELIPVSTERRLRVRARTDVDGIFQVLAKPGIYNIEVVARDGSLRTTIPDVSFPQPGAFVTVELPEGEITGSVVTAKGAPVPGAHVEAEQIEAETSTAKSGKAEEVKTEPGAQPMSGTSNAFRPLRVVGRSDSQGYFRLMRLAPGSWHLRARSGASRSLSVPVNIQPGSPVASVTLRLEEEEEIRGFIYSARGVPITGAKGVITYLPTERGDLPEVAEFITEEGGAFRVMLRGKSVSQLVNLEIAARGLPAIALRLALPSDSRIYLPDDVMGTALETPQRISGILPSQMVLVRDDGAFLRLSLLAEISGVADLSGFPTMRNLGGGTWKLVRIDSLATYRELALGRGATLPAMAPLVPSQ